MYAGGGELWTRLDEIIERAPSLYALRRHRVHLIAVRAWRACGRPIPAALLADERHAAVVALAAPVLLARVRAAYDGRVLLMKGPEAAAAYPDPSVRPFEDLDLIVDDARATQRALLASGFVEVGDEAVHHLRPLAWPSLPVRIELHHQLKGAPALPMPSVAEIFELTCPSATGIDGVLAPIPAVHAVLLAVHGWAHEPLGRLSDLIDVAVMLDAAERDTAAAYARRWGFSRVWQAGVAAADALLLGGPEQGRLAPWCRHLRAGRERTVLQTHLARVAAPAHGLHRSAWLKAAAASSMREVQRRGDESWEDKLRRGARSAVNFRLPWSEHDQTIDTQEGVPW